ncbi:hypothetical protein NQ314_019905 [Rhamnusium bicolor]|uniref:B box-type domain-containing protein n=1 Tax=Rhamnusium bicolor TaxID=1586634 RepID=A0AAV8WLG4_9CUCU|nr:hypothetical protein NQ314_019905 [Rhamnusium bicolor]
MYDNSSLEVYTGQQSEGPYRVSNSPGDVVMRLCDIIKGTGRNITIYNWLTKRLQIQQIPRASILGDNEQTENRGQVDRCAVCSSNKSRKTRFYCRKCSKFICLEHIVSICDECHYVMNKKEINVLTINKPVENLVDVDAAVAFERMSIDGHVGNNYEDDDNRVDNNNDNVGYYDNGDDDASEYDDDIVGEVDDNNNYEDEEYLQSAQKNSKPELII